MGNEIELARLPVKDQELFKAHQARQLVLKTIEHNVPVLGRTLSDAAVQQFQSIPSEEVEKVLNALEKNPASDVIRVIANGGFSEKRSTTKTTKTFNPLKAAYNWITKKGKGSSDSTMEKNVREKNFVGDVTASGNTYKRPVTNVHTHASEFKSAAYSSNGNAGAAVGKNSARSIATGEDATAGASGISMHVEVYHNGGKIKFGGIKAKNDQTD